MHVFWSSYRDTKTGEAPRHWRWRGALVDYYTAEAAPLGQNDAPPRPGAPAVLLVHGFGAFGEQWRGQVRGLTKAGYEVRLPSTSFVDFCVVPAVFFVHSFGALASSDAAKFANWPRLVRPLEPSDRGVPYLLVEVPPAKRLRDCVASASFWFLNLVRLHLRPQPGRP